MTPPSLMFWRTLIHLYLMAPRFVDGFRQPNQVWALFQLPFLPNQKAVPPVPGRLFQENC